jgi:hypothetical protein
MILLPQPPECWNYRYLTSCSTQVSLFNVSEEELKSKTHTNIEKWPYKNICKDIYNFLWYWVLCLLWKCSTTWAITLALLFCFICLFNSEQVCHGYIKIKQSRRQRIDRMVTCCGRDQEDHGLRPAWSKSVEIAISINKPRAVVHNYSGGCR